MVVLRLTPPPPDNQSGDALPVTVDQDLVALAERCEKATGPDRELDEDIARAVGFVPWGGRRMFSTAPSYGFTYRNPTGDYVGAPPYYTGSIDAAMTLVPDGCFCDTQSILRGTAIFDKPKAWAQVEQTSGPVIETSACATLPLALSAAALRARASLSVEG